MDVNKKQKWDLRFLALAKHIAAWSKDPSSGVGAVITNGNKIVSQGYNGFPMGVKDSPNKLNDREHKYPRTIHAEMNAILFAQCDLKGHTLYCTHHPCSRCATVIIQSGIRRIVCYKPDDAYLSRWTKDVEIARDMFNDVSAYVVQYEPLNKE